MINNYKSVFLQNSCLVCIFSFLLLSTSAFSQGFWVPEKVHYGFRLNPTFGYMHIKNGGSIKSDGLKLGFSFGGTADYLFSKNIIASAELAITTINGGTNQNNMVNTNPDTPRFVPQNIKTHYQLRYLELPIAIKIRTNTIGEASNLYLKLGFDPAIKLSAQTHGIITTNGITSIIRGSSADSQIEFYRLSYLAGIGYDYRFNRDLTFTSGLIFNNGLSNIRKGSSLDMKTDYTAIEFGIYF